MSFYLSSSAKSIHDRRQGSNALNRSMQGLWSAQRKAKLNLNAIVTPQQAAQTTGIIASSSSQPIQSTEPAEVVPPAEQLAEAAPSTGTQADTQSEPIPTDTRPSSSKRKLRRNAGDNDGTKRPRTTTTTSAGGSNTLKTYDPPSTRLSDLGGVESCIEKVLELVAMPLCHPEIYLHTGVQPPRGVLLYGPPGCGKTLLANAIAGVNTRYTSWKAVRVLMFGPFSGVFYCRNLAYPSLVYRHLQSCRECRVSLKRP